MVTTDCQAGYATYDNATNAISRITLFNFADGHANMTFTIPKEVFDNSTKLELPNADPSQVTVKYLTAASTGEEFDVSWAGTTYNGVLDGKPVPDTSGRPGIVTLDCSNGCSVDVPGTQPCMDIFQPILTMICRTRHGPRLRGS
jgi:hypothetical protein